MEPSSFLEQALIYLGAGVIAVPLFRLLGLGSVLGYLVAGMAIGPWGLGLISAPETVLHFAEFGVVLLLFLVGLELNPWRLWTLRRPIFGLGGAQVGLTLAAVTAIAWWLGQPLAVALVIGMGFAMSSTAIGLATLDEKNLLPTDGGQASFAVLLFQDIAVIPLLLVVGLLGGEKAALDWSAAAKAIGLIAALVIAGRVLVRPALRYIAASRLREVFVAFSLLLVLGTAALSHMVGLSMALGAFLAGVMLAESEYRHELELDIEPFKGLLLGLFFIAIGMSVDLGLFARVPHLVLGIALALVALKMAVLFAVARPLYCGTGDAALFAVVLSQAGEFAFVLFAAAGGFVPRATLDLLNAAVAVSMLTTPLLVIAYERWLMPRLAGRASRAPDAIHELNPVIVAGFGRFGQLVVRVLRGLGIGATIVDHDPAQVETARRFGWKTYYGDATRLDLLERAGARGARVLVMAIDDPVAALAAVKRVRSRYPHLGIVARAHSRTDAYEYAELGVTYVREVLGSALDASGLVMRTLGYAEGEARRVLRRFRSHDEEQIRRDAPHRHDEAKLIALGEQGRHDLEALLTLELRAKVDEGDAGADQERRQRKEAG